MLIPPSQRAMKSIVSSRRKCIGTGTGAGVVGIGAGAGAIGVGAVGTGAVAIGVVTIGVVATGERGMSAGVTARRRDPSFNQTKAPRERGFLVCAWNYA